MRTLPLTAVILALIALVYGCGSSTNPPVNATGASTYGLMISEDTARGVVCYRFAAHDGIHCFKKKELLK